jgi:ribosomal protein S12 methylthiotransferase
MRTKSVKKNKINVITLGCSKNTYDSEVLMGQLKASGKDVVHEQEGNIVVILSLIHISEPTRPCH